MQERDKKMSEKIKQEIETSIDYIKRNCKTVGDLQKLHNKVKEMQAIGEAEHEEAKEEEK